MYLPDKPEEDFYPFEPPLEIDEPRDNDPTPAEEEELEAEALDEYEKNKENLWN